MTAVTSVEHAAALDVADPLAHHRDAFVGSDAALAYLDGNSLGRPLRATTTRMSDFVEHAWGERLIRGWDEEWFDAPLLLGDRLAAATLGAAAGQTVIGDSTSVLLYKILRAAVDHQRARDEQRVEIVVDRDNFPTDRYLVEGIAAERGLRLRWVEAPTDTGLHVDALREVLGERTAVVLLSHVAYQSGYLADAAAISALAHEHGALVVLDVCHSVGSVPLALDAWGVDLAVGCTYKYLNGGPGSPAFCYVAERHQDALTQPLQGWMGHADPFAMGPGYRPAAGMRRFLTGTPPIVAMQPIADMLALIEGVGMPAIRAKSVALTDYAIAVVDEALAPYGVTVASPRAATERGGHVLLRHPRMREAVAALWERDVIPDFRNPDGLRVGLSPLSTSFAEVRTGLLAVAEVLGSQARAGHE
ncbi:kynureninase [Nocardioides daejeonensis]|uniref:kynureninase n=1 Tax=Nocardioides daejeonensis TaxID=1046556 RepID=UPI000D74D182|nr:aminotransferase class V-fold PLP-dependent enzyme [Nocardioides daejeonensis]